jgi:tetratricopeptide (TPR) repeat protein/transcriptional regulator with XRE-family HTH domain
MRLHPLTQAREKLLLTRAYVAEQTGLSVQTLQRAESGTKISLYSRRQICEFFSRRFDRKVSPSELGLVYEEEPHENGMSVEHRDMTTQEVEREDAMKRREMLGNLGVAGLTMTAALFDVPSTPALTESLSRFFSRKHPRLTGTMLSEVEVRTRQCWQYLPFVANVVEANFLVFVQEHLRTLQFLLTSSPSPSTQKSLQSFVSEAAQVAGMLLYSLKCHEEARTFLSLAAASAQEAGNDALQAVALARLGNFLIDTDRANEALDPLETANRVAKGSATATVCSWIAASEADALAHMLRASDCDKSLGRSEDFGGRMLAGQDLYFTPFDLSWLEGYKGACYGRLGRSSDGRNARSALERALERLDSRCLFRQNPLLRDLAIAYSREKEVDEACRIAVQAVHLAEQANAPMELQRVQDFSQHYLTRWRNEPAVKDLDELLQTVQKKLDNSFSIT